MFIRYITVFIAFLVTPSAHVLSQEKPRLSPGTENRLGDRQHQNVELTEVQEQEVMTYLESLSPALYTRLNTMKHRHPMMYSVAVSKAYQEMIRLKDIEDRDPVLYARILKEKKLDNESRLLSREIRNLPEGSEKEEKKQALLEMLNQLFDIRQMNRLNEIEKLEQRLDELRANHERRLQQKSRIVQKRFDELIGKNDVLEW